MHITHRDFIQQVKFKRLFDDPIIKIPQYAHEGDVGFDLIAYRFVERHSFRMNGTPVRDVPDIAIKTITLVPHARLLIGTGYALELPQGLQLEIRGRSGNALNKGLVLAHGVGTIDNKFRGEIAFIALNTSDYAIEISLGDKIGQAVLMPYYMASFEVVSGLSETTRGDNGFGSTGYKDMPMGKNIGVIVNDPHLPIAKYPEDASNNIDY